VAPALTGDRIEATADARQHARFRFAIDGQRIRIDRVVELDAHSRCEVGKGHRYRPDGRQIAGTIALAPVLDQGDVRRGSCDCVHVNSGVVGTKGREL